MPNNWKTYKLEDIASFSYGKMPKKKLLGKGKYPTFSGYKYQYQYPEFNVLKDDLIVVARGVGGTGDVKLVKEKSYLTNLLIKIELDQSILTNRYFYYKFLLNNLKYLDSGSAQSQLTINDLSKVEVKIPPLPEQKAIANILSAIDDKIENNLAINKTLEDMAMALYKHWFVDFGPFQDGEFIDSELGPIPKGWEVKQLGEVTKMFAGGDKPKVFSKEESEGLKIPIYSNGISNEGLYGFTDKARVTEESVTVSARGTIGFVCLRMQPYLPIVRLVSVIPNREYLSSKYLFLCLKNEKIQGNGTTQQQLTVPDFKETKIIVPKIHIVNEFTNIMDITYTNIVANKDENKSLVKLRDTLLPKLISGEVRLKEFKEQIENVL